MQALGRRSHHKLLTSSCETHRLCIIDDKNPGYGAGFKSIAHEVGHHIRARSVTVDSQLSLPLRSVEATTRLPGCSLKMRYCNLLFFSIFTSRCLALADARERFTASVLTRTFGVSHRTIAPERLVQRHFCLGHGTTRNIRTYLHLWLSLKLHFIN